MLTGGEADKLGNRYEAIWTVWCMLQILNGGATSMRLEVFGEEGRGVEFCLVKDGVAEHHQVKRQHTRPWTVAELQGEGILGHIRNHLQADPDCRFVFVSQDRPAGLADLVDSAKMVPDFHSFQLNYLGAKSRQQDFSKLQEVWECSAGCAFGYLLRIGIEGAVESTLEEASQVASTIVDAEPRLVTACLFKLAFESIHKTLDADSIWAYIEGKCRLSRRVLRDDPTILKRIMEATDQYLVSYRDRLILGTGIQREEAIEAFDWLFQDCDCQTLALSGGAGTGKSGVVFELTERLIAAGTVVLTLRLDAIQDLGNTTRQMGGNIGLPASPAVCLGELCRSSRGVLIIDQLDFVSTASGRHAASFQRIRELLEECKSYPQVRIVLACRTYDLENDGRFSSLVRGSNPLATKLVVGLLSLDSVKAVLHNSGCGEECGLELLEFLRSPLHLSLYVQLREKPKTANLTALLELFYSEKQESISHTHYVDGAALLDSIIELMSSLQRLAVPRIRLEDRYPKELRVFLSEGLLVETSEQILFFHETFFDFVFARRFVGKGESLIAYLRSNDQGLFVRSVVRQVLAYRREKDFDACLTEVQELLSSDEVRFHLKWMTFRWMQSLGDPRDPEWELLQRLQLSADADVARQAWGAVFSPAWLRLLERNGWIRAELLCDDESRRSKAINLVAWNAADAQDIAAKYADEWARSSDPWPSHALYLISRTSNIQDRSFIDTYILLLQSDLPQVDTLPFATNGIWSFYELPESHPGWALDIFDAWLGRYIKGRVASGLKNPFYSNIFEGVHAESFCERLETIITADPGAFALRMLPIMLDLIKDNAVREGIEPYYDAVWRYRDYDWHGDLHDQIAQGVAEGIQTLVRTKHSAWSQVHDLLRTNLQYETVGWLLAHAFLADPEEYANEAAEFLMSNIAWRELGESGWKSRDLISAISPFCSPELFCALEAVLLETYSAWELRGDREYKLKGLGNLQLTLLNGLDPTRQSSAVRRRLGELRRKFNREDNERSNGPQCGIVGPPFDGHWQHMTDDHWLGAMSEHNLEGRSKRGFLHGGAHQLGGKIEEQTTAEPERFARLLLRMPGHLNTAYFDSILRGLREARRANREAAAPADLVWRVIKHVHELEARPSCQNICGLLEAYADQPLPSEILDVLCWYGMHDPNLSEDLWQREGRGDASHAGWNSVRGSACLPVARILSCHPEYYKRLSKCVYSLVNDPTTAVRTQAAAVLTPLLNMSRSRAVALFMELVKGQPPELFESRFVVEFLSYAVLTHLSALRPILQEMLRFERTANLGAQLSLHAFLGGCEADDLLKHCLSGSEQMRAGVAAIAASRIGHERSRQICEEVLRQLFNDPSATVQQEVSRCFRSMSADQLATSHDFIGAFVESPSFDSNPDSLLYALEEQAPLLPSTVCLAFEQAAAAMVWSPEAASAGKLHRFTHHSKLIVQLYDQTTDLAIRRRCLDIIDNLARTEAVADVDAALRERSR